MNPIERLESMHAEAVEWMQTSFIEWMVNTPSSELPIEELDPLTRAMLALVTPEELEGERSTITVATLLLSATLSGSPGMSIEGAVRQWYFDHVYAAPDFSGSLPVPDVEA